MSGRLREPFALVPDWVDERITDGTAMRLYVRLARKYADVKRDAFPREDTLAEELGISERTVRRALSDLVDAGALVVSRDRKSTGHYGQNLYHLPTEDPRRESQEPQGSHQRPYLAAGSDQDKQTVSAGGNQRTNTSGGQRTNMASHQRTNMADQEPDPINHPEKDLKPSEAGASAAQPNDPTDEADANPAAEHLFASEAGFNPPPNGTFPPGGTRNGSPPKSSPPRKPRTRASTQEAPPPNAQPVVGAWIDEFRAARNGAQPTQPQIKRAGRCARELLDAGNDLDRVMEAARRAGQGGWPSIDTEFARMTAPRNGSNGRNGHTPYQQTATEADYRHAVETGAIFR